MPTTPEDQQALDQFMVVKPAWTGMTTAAKAVGLERHHLLHSGPPAAPSHALVTPTLNSASVACVYEGWAADLDEADALVTSGEIIFEPAQDRNVATPLAAVVSPSMRVLEMSDLNDPARRAFAPLNGGGTGAAHAARYGIKSQDALDLIRFLNDEVADAIAPACANPIPWLPIIDDALTRGDDAHLRHLEAHKILVGILTDRLGSGFAETKAGEFAGAWPIFHLNFWMAAAKCILSGASGVAGSGLITAIGANGATFGMQVSGLPGKWFTAPADVPKGNIRDPYTENDCTGAYGDSALAEGFGLGAMAQSYCPDMQALHKDFTPDNIGDLPGKLLMAAHPGLPNSGARAGLSARAVVESGIAPIVELGLVENKGEGGGLGAGLYRPPLAPFMEACAALNKT
jgi:hypothetical protein